MTAEAHDPNRAAPAPRLRRNLVILLLAQALVGAQMPMIFTVAGLAGQWLAPNPCLATLPISVMVFGSMTTAPWLSPFMQRRGRRAGFILGTLAGAFGAAIAVAALWQGSFLLFALGAYFSGIYQSAQGFYRFAAADEGDEAFRARAISRVMAAGLVGAILGPQLAVRGAEALVVPFAGTYLIIIAINLAGMLLLSRLDAPPPPRPAPGTTVTPIGRILRRPPVVVAMICGLTSYALMNLVMTSTPLAMVGCGFSPVDVSHVITGHVLAMFAPAFFTGHLIARLGAAPVTAAGLLLLAGAGAVAVSGVEITHFLGALVLLGLGWNFGFIGATAMLTRAHTPEERGRVQGINDLLVFGGVTMASLFSGGLMNCAGGSPVAGWTAVNLAMLPLLVLAGGAVVWLMLRPGEFRPKR